MLKIALTGSIASGKSFVLSLLKKRFSCIDSDKIVHFLYNKKEVQKKLLKHFKTFNRKKLAGIVFSNNRKKILLEKILWPLTIKEINKKLRQLKLKKEKIVIIDVPLLFEAKLEKKFDLIIVVFCEKKQQIQRLVKKGFSLNEAKKRIESQISLTKKIKKADFVIDNSGSINKTKKQVRLLGRLLKVIAKA